MTCYTGGAGWTSPRTYHSLRTHTRVLLNLHGVASDQQGLKADLLMPTDQLKPVVGRSQSWEDGTAVHGRSATLMHRASPKQSGRLTVLVGLAVRQNRLPHHPVLTSGAIDARLLIAFLQQFNDDQRHDCPVERHETLSSCGRRRMGEDHLPVSMHQPAVTSLEFVPAASGDDAPLGRNNVVKAGPKQERKK